MTITHSEPAVIPAASLVAALKRLTRLGFQAAELHPDESAAEIAVAYCPRRRKETASQAFMRATHDTTYWRLWSTLDGSARITSDQFEEEWTFRDLDEAIAALGTITAKPGRV